MLRDDLLERSYFSGVAKDFSNAFRKHFSRFSGVDFALFTVCFAGFRVSVMFVVFAFSSYTLFVFFSLFDRPRSAFFTFSNISTNSSFPSLKNTFNNNFVSQN
jgi:hypothetical protein